MTEASFLKALRGKTCQPQPVWFMRQAGRYLPEYRAVREQAGSFLDLCFNPELAAKVTLQPIRRYDLDAAILFADILLIPMVLGQDLTFITGEGPRLSPPLAARTGFVPGATRNMDILSPVYETVSRVRAGLAQDKALIGFAGAPWTVATYMIAGRGTKDTAGLRQYAYENPDDFALLMAEIETATTQYLIAQIDAGADAVQIFESWASGLPADFLREWCLKPAERIARAIRQKHPHIPVLVFPKGAGTLLQDYAGSGAFDGLGLGTETDPVWARKNLASHITLQGGLDPLLVATGGERMRSAARHLKEVFADTPYIFNLGHGFIPQTPPENVAELVALIRE